MICRNQVQMFLKNSKKIQNVVILTHIAVICDKVMRKKYKLGVGHFHEKKASHK